jgi:16S rRNA (adenine1518-N6/adenine1519-N6)-dimethyltransferase
VSRPPGRPKRSLGQNFLVDRGIAGRIVDAVEVGPGEVVLEIGPGRGALTEGLAEATEARGARLVLVELDDRLAEELRERYRDRSHVTVLQRDILTVAPHEITPEPGALRVVGNIPYNVTSPILFHLLTPPRPREIVLMVQKEVADRIMAEPGSGKFGALTVGVRTVADVEGVLRVPSGAFRPRPRVDSRVIRIRPHDPPAMTPGEEAALRDLTRALFQWRRKQLGKILRDHPDLGLSPEEVEAVAVAAGAAATDRPETVSPEGFIAMVRVLESRRV